MTELREDGEPRRVSYFSPPSARGLDLVIALDVRTLGRRSEVREVRDVVTRLAGVSGGQVFPVDRLDRLERALGSFADDLRHQYLLGFAPPLAGGAVGVFRRLAVDVRGGSFRVRAREGYRSSP